MRERRERPVAVGILAGSLAFRTSGRGRWPALTMAMPRPIGVAWTAMVPGACLFARLAVAAAELNATLWERRHASRSS